MPSKSLFIIYDMSTPCLYRNDLNVFCDTTFLFNCIIITTIYPGDARENANVIVSVHLNSPLEAILHGSQLGHDVYAVSFSRGFLNGFILESHKDIPLFLIANRGFSSCLRGRFD